jgi:regulator of sigma E protease
LASNETPTPSAVPDVQAGPAGFAGVLSRNLTTVVLVVLAVALLGYFLRGAADPVEMLLSITKVVVGLGLVVFIHELGHFVAAKWCDVYVQTFSIGFGGPFLGIFSAKWGETTYKIGWVPLGGYVKMMGEGEENEENADDPRSYKNKKVWQRMIIISAGVVMNMILAFCIYLLVFSLHGEERAPGVVGVAQPGGPAWRKGFRPGSKIIRIGDKQNPYFDEMSRAVMKAGGDHDIDMVFETFSGGRATPHEVQIRPIRKGEILAPMLLVTGSRIPELVRKGGESPTVPDSAASRAEPKFEFGDRIIAATDPKNSSQITPLREDPRRPGSGALDFYDLDRRFQFLLEMPVTLRVERDSAPSPVDIKVAPEYGRTIGLRMRMGSIVALREGSSAAQAGVVARDDNDDGDIIDTVEVKTADDKPRRWAAAPTGDDIPLDPIRLPTEMALWAASGPRDFAVTLTVARLDDHKRVKKTLKLTWDADWELIERNDFLMSDQPLSLGALGIAYRVQSTIAAVEPNSPAAGKELKDGDRITSVTMRVRPPRGEVRTEKREVKEDGWAYPASLIVETPQIIDVELTLSDERKVTLTPAVDERLPLLDRGLGFAELKILRQPDGAADDVAMTGRRMRFETTRIYENISGLVGGRLSPMAISGPITIATHSFRLAGRDTWEFLLFLAMININLAVVNFLPIPVLDGGHMVFLGYEALRGKPPSERWRFILTIMGLVVVLGLMIFGLALDFGRHLLDPLKRLLGL